MKNRSLIHTLSIVRAALTVSLVCLLLNACAGAGRSADSPGSRAAQAADEPSPEPGIVRVHTSDEVMYRVFAAEYLGSEGDLQGAVSEYLAAAMESDDPEIARRAATVAFAAEAWQEAVMAADRWALLDSESIEAHQSAATAMLQVGDYLGAEYQIGQILDLMNDSTDAWLMVSNLLATSGDPKQADLVIQQILAGRKNANSADVDYARSQLAIKERNLEKAYRLARQAVEKEPGTVRFLTWAGRLALNLNLREEGLAYIQRAWEAEPDDHDLALAYADLLARGGDADGARKIMKQMEQTPDVMLSRILFELAVENREAAEALFEKFDRTRFDDPEEKAFFQAQAAEAMGNTAQALELYASVKAGDKALAAALRRAELTALEGDMAGAREQLHELRRSEDPLTVEESWLAEARILREVGDREEAFRVLDQATRQMSGSAALLYTHALLAAELGWVDIAETGLRMIIATQPENAAALNALGYTLADQTERYEEAEALIRQAYILQPHEPSIIDSMGWIAFRLGRLDDAVSFLQRAWDLDKNPEIAAHLGEALWVRGDPEQAREIWRQAQEVDAQNPVLMETLERLGETP